MQCCILYNTRQLEDLSFNDLLAEPEHVVRAATPPSVAASTSPSSTIADTTAAPAPPPTPPESVSAPSPGATTASQRWTAPTASYFFDDDISPEQDPIMQRLAARKLHSGDAHTIVCCIYVSN